MEKGQLKIDGSTLQITPVNNTNTCRIDEIDTLLQQVPAEDSPKNILNLLNDNCLCEIFDRVDHLADFQSFSNVCKQFNQLARIVFSVKIRSRWINFDDLVFDDGQSIEPQQLITIPQLENFLYNFGSSIHSLKFRPFYFERNENVSNSVLTMINKYCKNICNFDVEIPNEGNQISNEIRPMLSRLRSFKFVPHHWENLISACTELVDVKLWNFLRNREARIRAPSLFRTLQFLTQNPKRILSY